MDKLGHRTGESSHLSHLGSFPGASCMLAQERNCRARSTERNEPSFLPPPPPPRFPRVRGMKTPSCRQAGRQAGSSCLGKKDERARDSGGRTAWRSTKQDTRLAHGSFVHSACGECRYLNQMDRRELEHSLRTHGEEADPVDVLCLLSLSENRE